MSTLQESLSSAFPPPSDDAASIVIPSSGESHQQDELSPVNEVDRERGIPQPVNNVRAEPIAPLQSPSSDLQSPGAAPPFPASAYHVPPKRRVPKAHAYRFDDSSPGGIDTTPSPERCQFMFSDGRQCTMGRYEVHPSLCRYHYEREEQLFGPPGCVNAVLGRELDLPELYSACRDLSNPAGVHRALAQVFRLLAQRRISRQEAATFAKLGHLLLRTISAACAEFVASPASTGVVERQKDVSSRASLPAANAYLQDALRGVNKSHQELSGVKKGADHFRSTQAPCREPNSTASHREASRPCSSPEADDATGAVILCDEPERSAQFASRMPSREIPPEFSVANETAHSTSTKLPNAPSADERVAVAGVSYEETATSNPRKMNTCAKAVSNPSEMNTYEIAGLEVAHNQHLHNNRGPLGARKSPPTG